MLLHTLCITFAKDNYGYTCMRKWIFKRRLKQNPRKRKEFVPYHLMKEVVVLFESLGEKEDRVYHDIIAQLQADGKQVRAFAFMEKSKQTMYHHEGLVIMDKKSVGCFRVPNEELLREVKTMTCDVLFDFTSHSILPLQYIMLYLDAKCRVGGKWEKILQPDFMIELPAQYTNKQPISTQDANFLFKQMLFYLKTIRTTP